ncbi:N-alpha-acetyltransferase 50 [Candida viswanathii]|uniref:N-alpha-acetyltransferase 50 n=1 Tax=Candida viswanathii TaxID=5486 RepID=A0A367Y3F8_9ASCO|nr:N-alpha-acetyltransferase 50 [Candida viswanathii]
MARDIIALDDLTVNNLGVFKKINEVTLPITYPESWYKQALSSPNTIVQLAYYAELPVGVVKARAFHNNHSLKFNDFVNSNSTGLLGVLSRTPNAVYAESFAVLQAYRGLGIGAKLVEYLKEETKKRFIHEIIIHVHVSNEDAIGWYRKQGFKQGELVKDYYKDQGLDNPDAYIFTLSV